MRSIHLATSLGGGAGIAARRINDALCSVGVESLLYTNDSQNIPSNLDSPISDSLGVTLLSKFNTIMQSTLIQQSNDLVTPISINRIKSSKLQTIKPDIVHIHATYNLLNSDSFIKLSATSIPILVTLHDQRFFTGGCHYSRDCMGYMNHCEQCPQVRSAFRPMVGHLFKKNYEALAKLDNVYFAAPSTWLSELGRASRILRNKEIRTIRNPIPTKFMQDPIKSKGNRSNITIGFASLDLHNPYKGLATMLEAFQLLSTEFPGKIKKISVVLIGKGDSSQFAKFVETRQIIASNETQMAKALKGLDYLVVPSDSDNLPSVVGEALMSGVRVIASEVGGTPEILNRVKGDLFPAGDSRKLASLLLSKIECSETPQDMKAISEIFSEQSVGLKYKKYYEDIIGR